MTKNKRALYRKTSQGNIFIKILTDGTFIAVFIPDMFKIAGIERQNLMQLKNPENLQKCLKSDFVKEYRKARQNIRL